MVFTISLESLIIAVGGISMKCKDCQLGTKDYYKVVNEWSGWIDCVLLYKLALDQHPNDIQRQVELYHRDGECNCSFSEEVRSKFSKLKI